MFANRVKIATARWREGRHRPSLSAIYKGRPDDGDGELRGSDFDVS